MHLRASEVAVMCKAQRLPEDQQAILLHDLATANAMIVLQLQVKLAYWQQLPYICFSLAHPDAMVARATMQKAKQKHNLQQKRKHPLSKLVFDTHKEELETFLSGASLQSCPSLQMVAAKLRFVSVVERRVEGLHAQVHMHLKHHVSLVHINFHCILPQLHILLNEQPTALQDLARHFQVARNLPLALSKLGLDHHPSIVELQHRWRDPHRSQAESLLKRNGVLPVIFHVDGPTLFQDLSQFQALLQPGHLALAEDNSQEVPEPADPDLVEPASLQTDAIHPLWQNTLGDLPVHDALLCKYACSYAVHLMKQAGRQDIFSLGPRLACSPEQVARASSNFKPFAV